ncbi:von Willebrand factor, type A [Rhodopseudomonas palustris HaA2]|uniref:von Willebrand factor, type A n=1 Tax=Rhodopseudomonas palustris (strain HaA2) TaxID=316058 RepID=Q2J283_RHOP2|nr:VWA domain-containing protein [Rhodopseudomonas palustris]ABD05427.1 von Willebrand factor, type A [Rhodopseudomonas palustris HaA2]
MTRITLMKALAFTALLAPLALPSTASARPTVEVAFVLDTTGSMSGLIEGAKRKIWSIATAILDSNPDADIRMGLVMYRDIGDDYVTRRVELTSDIQDLYARLLELQARGGGDWPESVNEALDVAVNKLHWTKEGDICRIVFLVGDAPPHMDYAQDTKYPTTLAVARQKDIIVNAVQAGHARDTERVWHEIAESGRGRYIPIPQDGGQIVVIETPYDQDIIILQNRINGTVIPYGPAPIQKRTEDQTRQLSKVAASAPASASDMASYINKRARTSSEAVTGGGDLVSDVIAGRQKLDAVKDEDLPDALRSLPAEQRAAKVESEMAARKTLNEQLATLVKQRDAYLAAQRDKQPKPASSFDREVEATLKAQLKR